MMEYFERKQEDERKSITAADVRPVVHGHWRFDNPLTADFVCSVCLERNDVCTSFCPYCGADMFNQEGDTP